MKNKTFKGHNIFLKITINCKKQKKELEKIGDLGAGSLKNEC